VIVRHCLNDRPVDRHWRSDRLQPYCVIQTIQTIQPTHPASPSR
jgi:hypothetical protein